MMPANGAGQFLAQLPSRQTVGPNLGVIDAELRGLPGTLLLPVPLRAGV